MSYAYDNTILKRNLSAYIGTTRNFQAWRDCIGTCQLIAVLLRLSAHLRIHDCTQVFC